MLDLIEFGATIRQTREARHWRPIDLAVAMGWSGTAPVYRIEHPGPAPRRPSPDTVNLLAQVLDLNPDDRMALMGFAGHLMDSRPLTDHEAARTVVEARPSLDESMNPVELFDFQGHLLDVNAPMSRILGVSRSQLHEWRSRGVTRLDLVCDPEFGVRERLTDVDAVAERQMLAFKLENRSRRHEIWYRRYPELRSHLPGFDEYWRRTEALFMTDGSREGLVSRLAGPVVFAGSSDDRRLSFEIAERGLHGAYGAGSIATWQPLDAETRHVLRLGSDAERHGVGAT